ncbi:anti-sigma factor family protein [Gallaecimonas mangrovi]|uniref:anti-sigma factor family protein n=1 Tax=Gallaecimonas mangrovi TaxID=2291597 RepID=UPI000E1FFC72|nr:anti-sigma factor [Gallaecimonas mangrovi]
MKPTEQQLHAFIDGELDPQQRPWVQAYLATHPEEQARLAAFKNDASELRSAFDATASALPKGPDVAAIRRQRRQNNRRRFATAAALVLALGAGWLAGSQYQDRRYQAMVPPMNDAVEAYRLFSNTPDQNVSQSELDGWFDEHFKGASLPPQLADYGLKRVAAKLMATAEGPAAMVLYRNGKGQTLLYFIRPPGPNHHMLPDGQRQDGSLLARYWSDKAFNYALVSLHDNPLVPKSPFGGV